MESIKKKEDSKNTLQQVVEQERAKTPSKFEYNKVIFAWEANDRVTYAFSGSQKAVFTAMIVLFGLYFIWIGQPILTLVAAAVFFILFIFVSIPPERAKHQIEKVGLRTMDLVYVWDDLRSFWMTEKDGIIMLYVNTRLNFPTRLIFLVESFEEAFKIATLLIQKLEYKLLRDKQVKMEKMLEGTYIEPTVFFGQLLEEEVAKNERPTKK